LRLPFSYTEFSKWYEKLARNRLEPARLTFERILNEHLYRVRILATRVKQPLRVWAKMQKPRMQLGLTLIPPTVRPGGQST
jgi:hypothetical protein